MIQTERRIRERRGLHERRGTTLIPSERRVSERRHEERRGMSAPTEEWLTPRLAAALEVVLVGMGFLLGALLLMYLWT
jgi:hypothetical protein